MDATPAAFQKGRIDVDFEPTCRRSCWFDKAGWLPYCTDNGIAMTIRRTNPSNPLRNIRVIMPGFFATHEAEPFHPWFLKHLERFAIVRFMDWGHTNEDSFVKRAPMPAKYVRFTSLATLGGSLPRISELLLRGPSSEKISCTSTEAPALCDGDPETDWAPLPVSSDTGPISAVVQLADNLEISNYMWMTSGWQRRVDPIMWKLEVSQDGQTWTAADTRSTRQAVTYYRRRFAAFESPEEDSWYPLRSDDDTLKWKDRSLRTQRTQRKGPMALEYQSLLVNTIGSSPWVCIHHLASDDYVRQEALYWLKHLRPDVKVYVEHSNEVWNPLFPQGRYATEKGTKMGLADNTCRTMLESCARVRYNAYRSKQIFGIWADVWGSSRNRLKFVLSTQTSYADITRDLLSMNQGAGADLLGVTAYMTPVGGVDATYSGKNVAEVMQLFTGGIASARQHMRDQKALAQSLNLGLAVYEGGVGLVQDGVIENGDAAIGAITELLMATGRIATFESAIQQWLDMFREELGDSAPFNYFVDTSFWSKYGQWGMREYYDAATATSPAAAAVHAHLDKRDGPRPGCVKADSAGRGLPPDSFFGQPAVSEPVPGAILVKRKKYKVRWGPAERLPAGTLDFYLWQRSSCQGERAMEALSLGQAPNLAGTFSWQVPDGVKAGNEYFIELRPRGRPTIPSNYSSFFSIVEEKDAPPTYLLT
eukprot:TRINITY_DN24290_c0_g2_i1.p1 TRINITY_DN24290_c0_g2~~TRINITY_DN24290_c0_g2_i1.p1  ORF type:complete len:821 (-),score=76.86 TRINITY_DN24290_c0_g2_i1:1077-3191(-)